VKTIYAKKLYTGKRQLRTAFPGAVLAVMVTLIVREVHDSSFLVHAQP
jgi:hypothetical protein